MSEREVEGVRLSNPDKILYPEQGITKAELAEYHVAVADLVLPHVAFRPVTMVRCPTGRQKACFYQRHAGAGLSRHIYRVDIKGFEKPYLYVKDISGLVAMVQMGTLEIHPWGVRVDRPEEPDRAIFDLDPGEGVGFPRVVEAALALRERLDSLGLASFVKTTGGKGLHVVVPLDGRAPWPRVKAWTRSVAEGMAADSPEKYLVRIPLKERVGKIFIDYLRNDPTATAIGPYSTRARPGAPVALPLAWDALDERLDPSAFDLRTVPGLVEGRKDPWADIDKVRQTLPD